MPLAIFGYGSLMDEEALRSRTSGAKHFCRAELRGYRLVFDKPGITHRYLNIQYAEGRQVPGVVVYVTDAQFADLARREVGYHVVDVTQSVNPVKELLSGTRVVAFIHFGLPFVRMSYLNRGLRGFPPEDHVDWLAAIDFREAMVELDELPICSDNELEWAGIKTMTTDEVEAWWGERSCTDLEALRRQA